METSKPMAGTQSGPVQAGAGGCGASLRRTAKTTTGRKDSMLACRPMQPDTSALALILTADPTLLAIVRLSLLVSLSAVALAALIGIPLGAFIALTRFRGREGAIVVLNALMGLPPVV